MTNEIKQPIQHFRASDMPLVAFLRYNNCTVEAIEKRNEKQAEFIFTSVDRTLLDVFNTDKGLVEPKVYADIMRRQIQTAKQVIRNN